MKRIIEFDNEADALALQAKLDAQHGYPKQGTRVGGGVHRSRGVTEHLTPVHKHPTEERWAIAVDDDVVKVSIDEHKAQAYARVRGGGKSKADADLAAKDDVAATADWFHKLGEPAPNPKGVKAGDHAREQAVKAKAGKAKP